MILLALIVLGTEPMAAPAECRADSDCLVSTFRGCCGACCGPAPFAASRERDAADRRRCAIVDCAAPRCEGVECAKQEPASAFRAACESGRCVAKRAEQASECTKDADCRIDWIVEDRRCGCSTPVAVPVTRPKPPAPRPLTKADEKAPQFGLSQGSSPSQRSCGPCAPQRDAHAACAANRCTVFRAYE